MGGIADEVGSLELSLSRAEVADPVGTARVPLGVSKGKLVVVIGRGTPRFTHSLDEVNQCGLQVRSSPTSIPSEWVQANQWSLFQVQYLERPP